jgi:ABC-2 type transport system permease protein
MSGLRVFRHQLRFELKLFWRNPGSVFFSVALPLIFLILIGVAFGGGDATDATYGLKENQYLVAAIATLGIVGAAFNNVAMTLVAQREMGVLKRLRGTPLPTSTFVLARTTTAVFNALMIVLVIFAAGRLAFGAAFGASEILGALVVSAVGAASFAALGFAITVVIRSYSAATPVTNTITLPLYFVSGVFGDVQNLPTLLADIGRIFPISHLGACLFESLSPDGDGLASVSAVDAGVLIGWGLIGLAIAVWKFRWEPQGEA